MNSIFVYGVLKNGTGRVAWVRGDIYNFGGCPGVRRAGDPQAGWIKGELHQVNDDELVLFDRIEDVPRTYDRVRVRVFDAKDGEGIRTAWVYEFQRPIPEELRCGEEWTPR